MYCLDVMPLQFELKLIGLKLHVHFKWDMNTGVSW